MEIDLHLHSNYSFDSDISVLDIIKQAKAKNIKTIAITDHNEVSGSLLAVSDNDLEIIKGIEIDCFHEGKIVHLLGYGCDLTSPYFDEIRDNYHQEIIRTNNEKIKRLNDYYKTDLSYQEVVDFSSKGVNFSGVEIMRAFFKKYRGRDFLKEYLLETGEHDIVRFFWSNYDIDKPCYVKMELPEVADVIRKLKELQGVAILAHPKVNTDNDLGMLESLYEKGIDGVEAYCSYHQEEDGKFYYEWASKHGLLITCGSDYHGTIKPGIEIGGIDCPIPYQKIIKPLKALIAQRAK